MKDITTISSDLVVQESVNYKAANVLSIQVGDLEYAPDFGIDIEFFIDPDIQFQNESFKAYLIQRLSEHHVNVNQVLEVFQDFVLKFTFYVGDKESLSGGFIR